MEQMRLVCGKEHVNREQLAKVPTPESTERYKPVSHRFLVDQVEERLIDAGFKIKGEDHVLARGGQRYFGAFAVTSEHCQAPDRLMVCGVRNTHDKSAAAGICIGTCVMVCENMEFGAEHVVARRHTMNIFEDLPGEIVKVIHGLAGQWEQTEQRHNAYRNTPLNFEGACAAAKRLVDVDALPKQKLSDVIDMWRQPELDAPNIVDRGDFIRHENGVDIFDEVGYKNALDAKGKDLVSAFGREEHLFGLFQAYTGCLKGTDGGKLPARTIAAQQKVFDGLAKFSPVALAS